jgi:hypothetical protein
MTNKKSKKRKFKGMSYYEIQRTNSKHRNKLPKEEQKWLKNNGYKNVGWDNVIKLYEFLKRIDDSLEEFFLEADRIGNKYLTNQEIEKFNQILSKEINEIAEEFDRQFPDTKIEIIDFSQKTKNRF